MPDVSTITSGRQNAVQSFPPLRRKVTFACETCRKRRVKCSGRLPCQFCTENGRTCAYDDKSRGRRGPRPRQTSARVTRPLAPAPPRDSSGDGPLGDTVHVRPIAAPLDDSDAESDEDSSEDGDVPQISTWKPGVASILFPGQDANLHQEQSYLDLVCHLLELLWSRAPLLTRLLLPHTYLAEQITKGTCPRGLLLAICAYTAKFSVHKAASGAVEKSLIDKFETEARTEADLVLSRGGEELGHIQLYCVLAGHAASNGDGRRAWIDIAIARSLFEIRRSAKHVITDPTQLALLAETENYLCISELFCSIGHSSLRANTRCSSSDTPEDTSFSSGNSCQFRQLLSLLTKIQELCGRPFSLHEPLPWKLNSDFQKLQDQLRVHLIRRPRTFYFNLDNLDGNSKPEDIDAARCALAWHCCSISLTRTFLPIPERSRNDDTVESDGTVVTNLNFPGAPELFLQEKIHSCEASAAAICIICRELVLRGHFFLLSPWLGYSCMQSALVLINQLHRTTKPYDERIVSNLKFAFTVLSATKDFHASAHEWIATLFQVHDTNTTLTHLTEGIDAAFLGYFNRFLGVEEPCYVTLHPKDVEVASKPERPAPAFLHDKESRNVVSSERPGAKDTWLKSYVSHLDENISDDESEVTPVEKDGSQRTPSAYLLETSASVAQADREMSLGQADGSQAASAPLDIVATMSDYMPGLTAVDDPAITMLSEPWRPHGFDGALITAPGLYSHFEDLLPHSANSSNGSVSNTTTIGADPWPSMMQQVMIGDEMWTAMLATEKEMYS